MTRTIYVDADACPVKQEVYTVAERHRWPVVVVANSPMMIPRDQDVRLQLVPSGLDAADDWIAERAGPGDVVVTADVPLASRCVKAGAAVIAPNGKPFTEASIGLSVAVRDLMTDLRSAGAITGGPKPFGREDRSRFLQALHQAIVRATRG
jgi:uncharacterized protein YaiI (UPF0178 family)